MSIARVSSGSLEDLTSPQRVAGRSQVDRVPERPPMASVPVVAVLDHGRARRVIELVVAVTALVLLSPLILLIALMVATTSRGPVLYRQQRVGAGGQPFVIIKFRTMCVDADRRAEALFAQRDDGSGPLNKVHDDPRVSLIGRWLRRSSLDELPQLWNVLNGSMALVGPRPASLHEAARFAPSEHRRHAVRPGVTGITQVSGRSDLDWEDAIRLDLYYVEARSLWLDFRILLRTFPAVLRGRGAY